MLCFCQIFTNTSLHSLSKKIYKQLSFSHFPGPEIIEPLHVKKVNFVVFLLLISHMTSFGTFDY